MRVIDKDKLKMKNGWKEMCLEDIGTLARGKSKHRPRWAPHLYGGDYPFIQTGQITAADKYITTFEQTYSEDGLKQSKLWHKGTLCITIAANIAEIAILDFPACFPDSVLGFIPDKEKADLDFVFYTLTLFQRRLKSMAIGSVQDNINLGTFKNITFPIPPLPKQKEIATILSTLDQKIALLKKQNQTLEELAQTLFKRWFVDFEFPLIKKDGTLSGAETYKSSGGKMIASELGEIPEGWSVRELGKIATLKSGYAFKSSDFVDTSETKALKIKDLKGEGRVSLSEVSSISNAITQLDRVQYFKLDAGDIVLAMSGNTTGKIGVVPPHENELYLNQRVGKFFMKDDKLNSYLYFFLMSGGFEEKILSMGYGSAQPNISPSQIENIELSFGTDEIVKAYSNNTNPLFDKVLGNNKEIQSLTQLRDTILPKLMSGSLEIKTENE